MTNLVTLDELREAHKRVTGAVVRTPLLPCLHGEPGRALWLKPENLQPIGAFKLRGAHNLVASLTDEERARGVVAHSSGNHAQAVAYTARRFGIPAVIVMPDTAPRVKVDATRALGAEIVTVTPDRRDTAAFELAAEHGYTLVPPYDDRRIVAGQGTAGLEIAEDLPDAAAVLVPVSGGGLLSGVATAVKALRPDIKVIGVEPELAADAAESLRTGTLTAWPAADTYRTIADGLRTTSLGTVPFAHVREYVDDIITVSESQIRDAVRFLAYSARLVAEPSGAVATAGYLFRRDALPRSGDHVAVVSGGNIEPALFAELVG
ncbi:MAG TPA: threonine/serine dehydratase [Yinghuangia sp.]|uniref:threonine ammonia-lyase n=1 Tax=Yinghuangia sp. YIM S10712 TaxID=3436930 RepID=UPI002C7B6816|nr:threonine/serine dehydratase [Yinghuangia sp.]